TWRVIAVGNDDGEESKKEMEKLLAREKSNNRKWTGFLAAKGYLCITYQNIEMKHSERFFFFHPINNSRPITVSLPDSVRERYEELIRDYQTRHEKDIKKWGREKRKKLKSGGDKDKWQDWEAAPSRFMRKAEEKPELEDGALVYARLSGTIDDPDIKFIVPVSVPRVMYDSFVASKIPGAYLGKCEKPEALCPACRTFGWVYGKPGTGAAPTDLSHEMATAYASRVQFSAGEPINGTLQSFGEQTLAILSSPKPTTSRFYLRPRNGSPVDGQPDEFINYNSSRVVLRGRKFYRHHLQANDKEYIRAKSPINGLPLKDDQNRTMQDALRPGARFKFILRFENLAPVELGALLWSLDFGGRDLYHRLGFAKPLGFGSLKPEVKYVKVFDLLKRCRSLKPEDWETTFTAEQVRKQWVEPFETTLVDAHPNEAGAFDDLPNIRDLKALLGNPAIENIHYPRLDEDPQPKGENFKWFMNNNHPKRGLKLMLPLAADDVKGFPLDPTHEEQYQQRSDYRSKKRGYGRRR
ncbi:MAG: TIGR03986 family type III CRISPR-associated RAMP protein, partial [bacterium]